MDHLQGTERAVKREPTHFSELDPKTMKVGDLRDELEARNLSSKGKNKTKISGQFQLHRRVVTHFTPF